MKIAVSLDVRCAACSKALLAYLERPEDAVTLNGIPTVDYAIVVTPCPKCLEQAQRVSAAVLTILGANGPCNEEGELAGSANDDGDGNTSDE